MVNFGDKINTFYILVVFLVIFLKFRLCNGDLRGLCGHGYYFDGNNCGKCHFTCEICHDHEPCAEVEFKYTKGVHQEFNKTRNIGDRRELSQECPDGQYFSNIVLKCTDCGNSCNLLCAYQKHCFECDTGLYLDLDTQTCVEKCDSLTQIAVNSTLFGNIPLCRSFSYFINPESESVVELGTKTHPYKSISSVFIEVLNLHAHTDRSIVVNIKEGSQNFINLKQNYIVNITSVSIQPYSSGSSKSKGTATLISTDKSSHLSDSLVETRFSIISERKLNLAEQVSLKPKIDNSDKQIILESSAALMVYSSALNLKNLLIDSDFSSTASTDHFIYASRIGSKMISIVSTVFETAGIILETIDPLSFYFEHLTIDAYKLASGFLMNLNCKYPEASTYTVNYANNITMFYSKQHLYNKGTFGEYFNYRGGGLIELNNFNLSVHGYMASGIGLLNVGVNRDCLLANETFVELKASNFYVTKPPNDIYKPNTLMSTFGFGAYYSSNDVPINIKVSNVTTESIYEEPKFLLSLSSIGPPVDATLSNLTIIDSKKDIKVYLWNVRNAEINNIAIKDSDVSGSSVLVAFSLYSAIVRNILIQNVKFTGTGTGNFIALSYQSSLAIDGVSVANSSFQNINSVFGFESSLKHPTTIKNITVKNTSFDDHALFEVSKTGEFTIENLVVSESKSINSNSKALIDLSSKTLLDIVSVSMININLNGYNAPLLAVNNKNKNASAVQTLLMSSVICSDMELDTFTAIIDFHEIVTEGSFMITVVDLKFHNVTFNEGGNLMNFQHQTKERLSMSNLEIYSIFDGGITIESTDFSLEIQTKIDLANITASNIDAKSRSFFEIYSGADVRIYNSSFSQISSLSNGAIVYAGASAAHIEIYNSSFTNNSAIYGGVFMSESQSSVTCNQCEISNNFAISSGVIDARNDGYYELNECNITGNKALYAPVSEVYSTQTTSVIRNSAISQNRAFTKQQILDEILNQSHISRTFKDYLNMKSELLDHTSADYAILAISGVIEIKDQTHFIDQDLIISVTYSTLTLNSTEIIGSSTTGTLINVLESVASIENLSARNVSKVGDQDTPVLFSLYSNLMINNVAYTESSLVLFRFFYSQAQIVNIYGSNLMPATLIDIRGGTITKFQNAMFTDSNPESDQLVSVTKGSIGLMSNTTFKNINGTILAFSRSSVEKIDNLRVDKSRTAIWLELSNLSLLSNSMIREGESTLSLKSGGIHSSRSNMTVSNTTFLDNTGIDGGAIDISCEIGEPCAVSIMNSTFIRNNASSKGGAIHYDLDRPKFHNNVFTNNSAPYGVDIASYPVKIARTDTDEHHIYLDNVGSGILLQQKLNLSLLDYDGQIVNHENEATIKILSMKSNSKIEGTNYAKLSSGQATFDHIIFVGEPGSEQIEYALTSSVLSELQVIHGLRLSSQEYEEYQSKLIVSFRYCQPGEIIASGGGRCLECAADSFSLIWNSTECQSCINHATCYGGANIVVDRGFWRNSHRSSSIIECPNKDACLGGYSPNSPIPVECQEGYEGYLCSKCQILDDAKYQPLSKFRCTKCLDPAVNVLRMTGLSIVMLLFLSAIIFINIRKRNENQFSILVRILVNYLQLLSLIMVFDIDMPSSFTDVSSQSDEVGSPQETFFSFDCFIEDYEIKEFAPSNMIFKSFLLLLAPLILIVLVCIAIGIAKGIAVAINKSEHIQSARLIVISTISIVFLLHPMLTLEGFKLLQCIKIDEGERKMLMHMEYNCYSWNHLKWAFSIGLPMIVIWVICMPLIAFIILTKNRHRLEKTKAKKYLLLLYQGLKPKHYYWEIANILRKVIILCIFIVLSEFSAVYQILFSSITLLGLLKLQLHIKPYKLQENNFIETRATVAIVFTLICGVLFVKDYTLTSFRVIVAIMLFFINF